MCVCDETGVCPPGCRYRPGGTAPWGGHDRYPLEVEPLSPAEEQQARAEQYEREGRQL